jgi:hypothetical protein
VVQLVSVAADSAYNRFEEEDAAGALLLEGSSEGPRHGKKGKASATTAAADEGAANPYGFESHGSAAGDEGGEEASREGDEPRGGGGHESEGSMDWF